MFLMKKIFLGLGFLFLISLGGAGTQSNSLFMQGMGFFGIVLGLVILYVFVKMVWRGIGCLPSFLILSAIVLFMMYSLGMFNNGLVGVGESVMKFIGYESSSKNSANNVNNEINNVNHISKDESVGAHKNFNANFSDTVQKNTENNMNEGVLYGNGDAVKSSSNNVQAQPVQQKQVQQQEAESNNGGILKNVIESFSKKPENQQKKVFNPNYYPVVYGSVRVVNADTLIMYDNYFKLYGIDATESNQMCANKSGRSYNCGREAAMWLKSWINDNELECHVIRQNTKGDMEGTCSYGPYDLGAALVNAGWAVADVNVTDIYYPYEMQAKDNRRGLWQGQFYMPWDWRKMQNRKAKIKVESKKKKKGMFGI